MIEKLTEFETHIEAVMSGNESCESWHEAEQTELNAEYVAAYRLAEHVLAAEVTVDDVFVGGNRLYYKASLEPDTAHDGGSGDTLAAIERWFADDESIVRVSQTRTWTKWDNDLLPLLAAHLYNKPSRLFSECKRQQRTDQIVELIRNGRQTENAYTEVQLHQFPLPDQLDAVAFEKMRNGSTWEGKKMDDGSKINASDSADLSVDGFGFIDHSQVIARERSGAQEATAWEKTLEEFGPFLPPIQTEAGYATSSEDIALGSKMYQQARALTSTTKPTAGDIARARSADVHTSLREPLIVVYSLAHILPVIREGRRLSALKLPYEEPVIQPLPLITGPIYSHGG